MCVYACVGVFMHVYTVVLVCGCVHRLVRAYVRVHILTSAIHVCNYLFTYLQISEFTCSCMYIFMCTYVYLLTYSCMHIFACTFIYLRVSLFIHMYCYTRRYFMNVIRSLNLRLIADLHGGCDLFHTSGRKWGRTWRWAATWKTISYEAWAAGEPNGTGKYLYVWNKGTPVWGSWDDDADKNKCFVCERRITVPSYC